MAVNKVVYDGETLVDLTGDNVSESTLLSGATAHNAAGEAIVGTVVVPTIDSALSADSTNPVQNKVINTKFASIQSDIDNKVPLSRTINGKALTTNITLTAADVGALPNTTVIPSIEGLATETYVNNKFASIVDSAPETLDTLKELSDALGNDPNFATTVATQIGGKVDKVSGKGLSSNDYTTNEKNKLAGIAAGAEVNQNTFSNVIIAGTTISAVNKQDSLTLVAGNNITLTPDASNKKVTITSKDTVYTHPSYTSKSSGLYKITVDGTGHVSGTTTVTKSDITALGIPAQDTTYNEATASAAGLMSAMDKTKLNGIAEGAEKNVQSDLSQTDNTATDYIKGVIRKESLPEGYPYKDAETILDGTFEFAYTDGLYIHQITDENFAIVDNESYAIVWDGKTYRCVAAIFNGSAIILGNLAIANAGADTGEPFLFVYQGGNAAYIYAKDTATTHTVTVCAEAIHQISEEFIPDIARGMILKNFNGVMPSSENWISVTYGNGKFVAVAFLSSKAAYREDDSSWKSAIMPSRSYWRSVTYGNGKFVAVADNSSTAAAYSEDGITWIAATLPSSEYWQSVAYGNGKFVAVSQNSTVAAYSADGITWTAATLPSSADWRSVTYGNGKFVAVAQDSTTAAYSNDGITWTATTMPSSQRWSSVTYGNGKFVAVSQDSTVAAYSTDGITWTATTMPSSAYWYSVTYGNGKFVAVGYGSDKAAYSTDGITWIDTTMPFRLNWYSVTYGNGKFVAVVHNAATVAYSRDGINWKTELKLISQNGKDVTADTLIALDHTQSASKISAGTFAGQVVANASGQTPGTKLIRNSKLMAATDFDAVTDWSSHITNGEIVWRYE